MITGLNHVTLAVSDLGRSVAFYSDLLQFSVRMRSRSSAYLESGALWLALVQDPEVRRTPLPEYTHIALSVPAQELAGLTERLTKAGVACWQVSERCDSFYFLDPDGHKLELHSGDLHRRLCERVANVPIAGSMNESTKTAEQNGCTEPGGSASGQCRKPLAPGR
jgi:catechol 2,3-dioxygenase-like lactoylglutathione lyase family enzyme